MNRPSDDELVRLGKSLREIDPSSLQQDDDGSAVRWFLGVEGTELFAWSQPGQPAHHFQLVFARVALEWEAGGGLTTGNFGQSSAVAGGRYDAYVLTVGTSVDAEVCKAADLVLSSSTLPADLLAPLMAAIRAAAV